MKQPSRKMTTQPATRGSVDTCAAFADAVERNRAPLIRAACRITRNVEEAEDIVQEAVMKAFISLHRFRGESRLETWLRTIVENTAYNWARRRRRGHVLVQMEQHGREDPGLILHEIPDTRRNPEQSCEFRELENRLMAAIDKLGDGHKAVIQMCVLGESSYLEAALALNLSLVTVKARIFRGRGILQSALQQAVPDRHRRESSPAVRRRRS